MPFRRRKKADAPVKTSRPKKFSFPAISVIIPMYNTEKYVGDCLNSLLEQTFQNFEVIIVDDCSTDNSVAVVENYRERFGGRLTLAHMEENSGGAGLPRNRGLMFSRGEYIFFMDADDMLTKTALEELYTLAEKYDAEVIYCEKNFTVNADGTNRRLFEEQSNKLINKPTFAAENLNERVDYILQKGFWGYSSRKLVRRDFLVEHQISFPNVTGCEDDIWTLEMFFFAKKILHVPNAVLIQRLSEGSLMRTKRTPQQEVNFWIGAVFIGLKELDDKLGSLDFFKTDIQHRHALLDYVVRKIFGLFFYSSFQAAPFEIYQSIKQKFGKYFGEHDVLISALATALNTQMKINFSNHQQYQKFAAQAQKRIAELEAEIKRLQSEN